MSYKTCCLGTLYFIRWNYPEAADYAAILRDLERTTRGRGKLKAVVCRVPRETPLPDDALRNAGTLFCKLAVDYVEQIITVIEGTGMKCTVMRAATSAMAAMSGTTDRSFSEGSVEAGLERCSPLPMPVEAIVSQLRREGLLDG